MTIRFTAIFIVLVATALSAPAQGQQDFSRVEIKVNELAPNLYSLEGQGGMMGALVGPDGVFLVDSQFAPLTEKLVAAVKRVTTSPIRFLVNTHLHNDHTGGNENFAKLGVILFSRDQLRQRLARPAGNAQPAAAAALPVVTYDGPVTLHLNGQDIQLIPIRRAHTDGDTLVRFPGLDVIFTGDYFRSMGYPNIDRANGGTLDGMLDGLATTIGMLGPNTKVIPGHGPTVDRTAIVAHRDMILVMRDRVAALKRQGKTEQEVVAAKLTADYDSKVPGATAMIADRFITQIYQELPAPLRPQGSN
jgi:glyoxylase-like metal-dependent hydrolase (beta-lactamase superfamily II)